MINIEKIYIKDKFLNLRKICCILTTIKSYKKEDLKPKGIQHEIKMENK